VADIEGVGDLAELAVADAVDSGRDLFLDDLPHRPGETSIKRCLLERPPDLARLQKLQQLGRSRQASDMSSENPLGARLHPSNLLCAISTQNLAASVSIEGDAGRKIALVVGIDLGT
jgi:hypothetical protein